MNVDTLNKSASKRWQAGTLTYTAFGVATLFCWLLWGDFAYSLRERSVTSIVQIMLKKFEASDMLTSLFIGTIPSVCNLVISPIISYRSDRHRGRWGRRIPFLFVPTPLVVGAAIGLGCSPKLGLWLHGLIGAHSPGANDLTLGFLGVFWVIFEVSVCVVGGTVFNGLINDVVPAALIGRFYGLFRALSLLAGMLFNYWLLGLADVHYATLVIGVGLVFGAGFAVMCLKVREGDYPPVPTPSMRGGSFWRAAGVYCRECFTKPYYWWVYAAITLPLLAFAPVYLFGIHFSRSVGLSLDQYGKYIALTYFIALCISYPLGVLADRFHPLRVGIVAMILHLAVTLWGAIFATNATFYAIALIAQTVLATCWGTGAASLGQRLYPQARFAQMASAQGVLFSFGSIFLAPAVGAFLDRANHEYRYTFGISFGISVCAMFALAGLTRRFLALGGFRNYVAPE